MTRPAIIGLYVVALIALVVGTDVLFFKNHFWERLATNVGIVLIFGALFWRFGRAPRA